MGITSFIHGATGMTKCHRSFGIHAHASPGSISFQYPTTTGNITTIEGTAPAFTGVVSRVIQSFIANPNITVTHETFNAGGVDAGLWYNGTAYLLLVANLNSSAGALLPAYVPWADVGLGKVTSNDTSQIQRIFTNSQTTNVTGFKFKPYGIGIYTVTPPE